MIGARKKCAALFRREGGRGNRRALFSFSRLALWASSSRSAQSSGRSRRSHGQLALQFISYGRVRVWAAEPDHDAVGRL